MNDEPLGSNYIALEKVSWGKGFLMDDESLESMIQRDGHP